MLNITYQDRKTNIMVRDKTKVTDVIEQVRRRKWTWAGHVSRLRDNRRILHITTWKPYERKRPRGRPARCWRGELDDYWKGTIWQRIAQDRQMWKQIVEAFTQPLDTMAAQWWWWCSANVHSNCVLDMKLVFTGVSFEQRSWGVLRDVYGFEVPFFMYF